jgi:hypothetical protein
MIDRLHTCFCANTASLAFASAFSDCNVRLTFCSEFRSSSVCASFASVLSSFASSSCSLVSRATPTPRPRLVLTSISSDLLSSSILNCASRSRTVVRTGGATIATAVEGVGGGGAGAPGSAMMSCKLQTTTSKNLVSQRNPGHPNL